METKEKSGAYTHIVHPFGPLYDANSTVLILGSLPSVRSRAQNFFYGHPQNRFWPLMAALFGEPDAESRTALGGSGLTLRAWSWEER